MNKANVTHPELKTTFQLPILGVKKNPQSPLYTSLGVLTKGTIVEVNVSELGMVTTGGKVVWSSESPTPNPTNAQSTRRSPTTQKTTGASTRSSSSRLVLYHPIPMQRSAEAGALIGVAWQQRLATIKHVDPLSLLSLTL